MPEAWPSVAAAFTKEATAMTKPATGGRLPQGMSAAAMPTAASWRCSGGGTAMNAAELLSMPMPAPSMGCHRLLILLENANLQNQACLSSARPGTRNASRCKSALRPIQCQSHA